MKTGIAKNPSWYPGLHQRSRFEEVQAYLHEHHDKEADCPMPCAAPYWGTPSLFCVAVTRPDGYEPGLMKAQAMEHAGIFACDEYGVFSIRKFVIADGVVTIPFTSAPVGISKDGTAGNAKLFMNVWNAVKDDARWRLHDFIVKADPDTVLVPERLRQHLSYHKGSERMYVKNCQKYQGAGWPAMFGSLEVLSRGALQSYFASQQRCRNELPWQAWGEDLYMASCMDHLGVGSTADTGVLTDGVCTGSNCFNHWAAAYHPFKSKESWLGCLRNAK